MSGAAQMGKSDYRERFIVHPGSRVKLRERDPGYRDRHKNKREAQPEIRRYAERLRELQYLLYAEGRRSLLICLQALDAGGKDGTIRHVLGYMNPQGCRVHAFKVPTPEEAAHDFLWRVHKATPALGEVAIFNRSHYEDVLVARVHGLVPKSVWKARYAHINAFERLLADRGTIILKFFLHISPEEQLKRFRKRLDDPKRWWKLSEADFEERRYWDDYQRAYEDALSRCSTPHAPWFVIPADRKWFRNLAVSRIVVETLESLDMSFPPPKVDIEALRARWREMADRAEGA
jgi:PPK2 family polyphosphate:nucleotide phosphotransferase